MIKTVIKKSLKTLNDFSISVFCTLNFRRQAKKYCQIVNAQKNSSEYEKQIKTYWKKYIKNPTSVFHQWYTGCNGIADFRYIPEDFFYDVIERFYNNMDMEPAYCDKAMFRVLIPQIKQPRTVIANINGYYYDDKYGVITKEEAVHRVMQEERYIIKPTLDTGGGKNVRLISNKEVDEKGIFTIFSGYGKNFIVQEPIKQHPELSKLHAESINTIRVMSMLEDSEVKIVSAVIRMGVGNAFVDNECSGGINCGVDENGRLSDIAYDGSGRRYDNHPQGNYEFRDCKIPEYDKVIDVIKEQHRRLPYFGLISWDFSVDESGDPIMIELNMRWCGLNFHQLHHGPLFGDYTDKILKKVCEKGEV